LKLSFANIRHTLRSRGGASDKEGQPAQRTQA